MQDFAHISHYDVPLWINAQEMKARETTAYLRLDRQVSQDKVQALIKKVKWSGYQ
jgi:hypothetical protein